MGPQPADYEYDVFFSYKRHALHNEWHRWVVQRLRYFLTEELNVSQARVFMDEVDIETGDNWPERLQLALKRSKCMVCVLSPPYFHSVWCCSEFWSFIERHRQIGLTGPEGLIAPLRFHDLEYFPDEAKCLQMIDVVDHRSTTAAFWGSARELELEQKIRTLAVAVAGMVRRAPAFRDDWPVVPVEGVTPQPIPLATL